MPDRKKIARLFASRIKEDNPGIRKIFLYGSVASGRDKKDSDIDLLVVTGGNRRHVLNRVMNDVVKTLLDTSVYVSAKVISEREYQRLKATHFISEIDKKGVLIGL
jgi:predicted nucleotidyltransferase